MIISHKHKFIFIKTIKVSGTSMEIALSHFLGNKDIITPLNIEDEILRYKLTKVLPKNYSQNKRHEEEYSNYIKELSKKTLSKKKLDLLEKEKDNKGFYKKVNFYNHISAQKLKKKLPQKIWKNYFKFTIERHPYDKVISFMYFANRFKKISNLRKEIDKTITFKKYLNYTLYLDEKKRMLVDYILNYSSLKKDIKYLEKIIKLDISKYYLKTKNYTRKVRTNYNKMLTPKQKIKIYNDAKVEFNMMGFKK